MEALERGKLDLGYIGLPPSMIGMMRGAAVKCVAGGHIEGTALVTTEDAGKDEAEVISFLQGKRIGCPPKGSIHDILIRHMLHRSNVTAEVQNYPWADFIPLAMEKGEIDAAIGTPALAIYLRDTLYAHIALPPERIWPWNPSYGIIVRDELIGSEGLKVFLEVHERACRRMLADPKKTARIISRMTEQMEEGFILKTLRLSPHYCSSLPEEYIRSTLDFIPVMKELGYINGELSRGQVFDTSLIDEIHPGTDHYHAPWDLSG